MIRAFIFIFFVLSILSVNGQNDNIDYESLENIKSNREEVQRYLGYEDLLFRFTTLPYDISQNTNQIGYFVDIGYVLLSLLPIGILALLYNRRKYFYVATSLFVLYLATCFSYAHLTINGQNYACQNLSSLNTSQLDFIDQILAHVYIISCNSLESLISIVNGGIAHNAWIVYVILFSLFILAIAMMKNLTSFNALWIIFASFLSLWLILSGGILWYGFILIPIGTIIIFSSLNRVKRISKLLNIAALSAVIIWLVISGFSRISYIDYQNNEGDYAGMSIINASLYPYSMGMLDEKETMEFMAPAISSALDKINSNEDMIYMIGTSYSFNIENNNRIFADSDLIDFYWIHRSIPSKTEQIAALKMSGFRYIIVDLLTPTLDRTPEQSLKQKYRLLRETLFKNPSITLIATDRIVEFVDSQGNVHKVANVFGQKLVKIGSYAIYEII